jgi:hypothetical protein
VKWNWLGADKLNDAMKSLENYLGIRDKGLLDNAVVRTTDATVTTLATLVIPVDRVVNVWGQVTGRRTGGSAGSTNDGAGYVVAFVCNNSAGTASVIGSASVTTLGESQAGWDCTVTFSSGNALIRVTGAANNNVKWIFSGWTVVSEGD